MIPEQVKAWCLENGYGTVVAAHSVGGGCINNGARLQTSSGKSLFLKTNSHNPVDMFEREAEGLRALAVPGAPRLPRPYLFATNFLLMEDLSPASPCAAYWGTFAHQLAALHNHIGTSFGFHHDNYIGSTPQPNTAEKDGYAFFANQRLGFQARLAFRHGLLEKEDMQRVEKLIARLPDLVPVQPPSLIHGDLWGGNAMTDESGQPALIDPAAHYGWAEAELGMTVLFGGFPAHFYHAYQEVHPLAPAWEERLPLYNLYHVLNHLNLFGSGYLNQARSILRRYI